MTSSMARGMPSPAALSPGAKAPGPSAAEAREPADAEACGAAHGGGGPDALADGVSALTLEPEEVEELEWGMMDLMVGTPCTAQPSELLSIIQLRGPPLPHHFHRHDDFGPLDSAAAAASAAAEAAADDGTVARTAFGDVLCVHPSGVDPDMGEHDGVWCGVCFEVALYGHALGMPSRRVRPSADVPRAFPHVPPPDAYAGGPADYLGSLPGACFLLLGPVAVHRSSPAGRRVVAALGPPPPEGGGPEGAGLGAAGMAALSAYEAAYWAMLRDCPPPGVLRVWLAVFVSLVARLYLDALRCCAPS